MKRNYLLFAASVVFTTSCYSAPTAMDHIQFDGIGSVKIGQTFDEVSKLWPGGIKQTEPGLKASKDCYHTSPTHSPGVTLMFQKELLVRIDLTKKPGQTNGGVKIGDTFSVLKRHYHNAKLVNQNSAPEEKQVTISSPDKKYAFRFYFHNSKIESISGGQADAVDLDEGCY
jgi:hypothetical protein